MSTPDPDRVRLLAIEVEPIDVERVRAAVRDSRAGGESVFVGVVRDRDEGKPVGRLEYTAHPTAADVLRAVADEITGTYDVIAVAGVHRVGELEVGDVAVTVAVAAIHRGEAIAGCHAFIDALKARVPIWKHQLFTDGSDEWVGTP